MLHNIMPSAAARTTGQCLRHSAASVGPNPNDTSGLSLSGMANWADRMAGVKAAPKRRGSEVSLAPQGASQEEAAIDLARGGEGRGIGGGVDRARDPVDGEPTPEDRPPAPEDLNVLKLEAPARPEQALDEGGADVLLHRFPSSGRGPRA